MTHTNTDVIVRELVADSIDVRESAEGRRVCGIAAPFGSTFDAGDYCETFRPGAFAKSVAERSDKVPLLEGTSDGLYAEFLISRTQRGEEALMLARDGVMHSFSVGFVPVREKRSTTDDGRPLVERLEVKLHHVGLISEVPAYDAAKVLAIRSEYDPDDEKQAPRLSLWRSRLYATDGGVLSEAVEAAPVR